jgi:hypothetical protein
MNGHNVYVIECRKLDGSLDFTGLQPESVYGMRAITGISENAMGDITLRLKPDAILTGHNITMWPSFIDYRWKARRKTW